MKIKNRRLLFLLAAVGFFLVVGIGLVVTGERDTTASVLPNPNGYDLLIQATRAIPTRIEGEYNLDHNGLSALIATNVDALRLLREGLRNECVVSTDAQITNFANITQDLIGLKSLARILAAEGRLAEMEGRPTDAAKSYVDAVRLGSAMSHGGVMVNRLVGIACEGVGGIPFVKLVPKLDCQQLRPLIADLEKVDHSTVPWSEVLQNENRFLRAQLRTVSNPISWVSLWWEARGPRKAAAERHEIAAAHLRLLIVELALRSYKCDHGIAPSSLKELVPDYLHSLPTDPFSGKPLVYRPAQTNWVLYSLGPDRVDDGGTPVGKAVAEDYMVGLGGSKSGKGPRKGDLFYDSHW